MCHMKNKTSRKERQFQEKVSELPEITRIPALITQLEKHHDYANNKYKLYLSCHSEWTHFRLEK